MFRARGKSVLCLYILRTHCRQVAHQRCALQLLAAVQRVAVLQQPHIICAGNTLPVSLTT